MPASDACRRTILVLLASLVIASAADARGLPVRLRMDGYIGKPPEGRLEMADLVLRCDGRDYRFQVTDALLLSGQGLASNLFDAVRPYRPSFFLRGPKSLLKKFAGTAPGIHMRIIGQTVGGTRELMVGEIIPAPDEKT
jgi:hypothetical protein